jgi:hypothetical protein
MTPLFLFIFEILQNIQYIHSIPFIYYIHPSSFAEVPLHFLIAGQLSGKNLPGVPSRESKSGLPYSKPTHCQLSYAAPFLSYAAPLLSYAAPFLSYAAPLLSYAAPLLSYAAPLLSYAAPLLSYAAPRQVRVGGARPPPFTVVTIT